MARWRPLTLNVNKPKLGWVCCLVTRIDRVYKNQSRIDVTSGGSGLLNQWFLSFFLDLLRFMNHVSTRLETSSSKNRFFFSSSPLRLFHLVGFPVCRGGRSIQCATGKKKTWEPQIYLVTHQEVSAPGLLLLADTSVKTSMHKMKYMVISK